MTEMIRPEAPRRRVLLGVLMLSCILALASAETAADRPLRLAKSSGGWFGVMVMDLFPESAAARGFGEGRGILVTAVLPGSPAEQAGLRPNDIVLKIDGRRLIWYQSMIALVQSLPAGRTVEVLVERGGNRLTLSVELGDLEAARAGVRKPEAMSRDYKAGIAAYGAGRHAEAAKVFEGLVDHGWAGARFALGLLYQDGQGRPRDHARAAHWYRLAAEQGETSAQHNLGLLYWNGEGVARNLAHAYYWVKRAADGGDQTARGNAERLRGEMSAVRIAMAEDWLSYQAREPSDAERERAGVAKTSMRPKPATQAAKPGGPGSQVKLVQMMLGDLGYRPGPVDGLMGRRTRTAIERYQRDRGVAVDGQIDESLVASLRSALAGMRLSARTHTGGARTSASAGGSLKLESLEGLDKF